MASLHIQEKMRVWDFELILNMYFKVRGPDTIWRTELRITPLMSIAAFFGLHDYKSKPNVNPHVKLVMKQKMILRLRYIINLSFQEHQIQAKNYFVPKEVEVIEFDLKQALEFGLMQHITKSQAGKNVSYIVKLFVKDGLVSKIESGITV